jgi:hypothetical protein
MVAESNQSPEWRWGSQHYLKYMGYGRFSAQVILNRIPFLSLLKPQCEVINDRLGHLA